MKKLSIIILLTVFLNNYSAQDSCNVHASELKHGIQFQIRSLSLRNFNDYTLAYRYLINKNSGLRIGILTNLTDEDTDGTQQLDSVTSDAPYDYSKYDFKISIQYLKTLLRNNDFSFFVGGGPFVSYKKSVAKSKNKSVEYRREYRDLSKSFGYGLDILFGVDYSLSENAVLSGEYGLSFLIENSDSERKENIYYFDDRPARISERSSDINRYSLQGIGVHLGLTIFL